MRDGSGAHGIDCLTEISRNDALSEERAMAMSPENVWVLIPARGGAKGIPRKNLRPLHGKPLILHVVERLAAALGPSSVYVSTEDHEIRRTVAPYVGIHARSAELANDSATLDEVAVDFANWLISNGADRRDILVTVQPTSPYVRLESIRTAIEALRDGFRSVISVRDDRGLRWTRDEDGKPVPLFSKRVNRQFLPPTYVETGGVIACRLGDIIECGTRIVDPVFLLELEADEAIDIDDHADWAVAEYVGTRRTIVIRADGSRALGLGHVYRALALCYELCEHNVMIAARSDGEYDLGLNVLRRHPFRLEPLENGEAFASVLERQRPDIVILDVLDTTREMVAEVRRWSDFVVTIEDMGDGTQLADLVINDLYADPYPAANHWTGVRYAILGPSFEHTRPRPESERVETILIAFGGTDPSNLTLKALDALKLLKFGGEVILILGPGYAHGDIDLGTYELRGSVLRDVADMAAVMQRADLAITSAGRTVTELMHVGVPTVALCQNLRELRHTHASSPYGVMNLGLGKHVDAPSLAEHLKVVLENADIRRTMRARALAAIKGRSNRAIVEKILRSYYESRKERDR